MKQQFASIVYNKAKSKPHNAPDILSVRGEIENDMFLPMQLTRRSLRRKSAPSPFTALTVFGVAVATLPFGAAAHAHPLLPGATLLSPVSLTVGQGGTEADADAALQAGDAAKAIALYTPLIQATPKKFTLYLSRGIAYFKAGQYQKASDDFSTFVTLRPALIQGYLNRAYAEKELGKADEGLADLTKVESLDATKVDEKLRGDLYTIKKAYPQAIASYTKYGAQGGEAAGVSALLIGDAYVAQGDSANAIASYTKGITAAPKNPYGYAQRGRLYITEKKPDLAIKDLTQYITLAPTDSFGYYLRGIANLNLKTPEGYTAAKTDLTKYLSLEKDPAMQLQATKLLANAQKESGDAEGAIASYTKVLTADSKDSKTLFLRGMAYMTKKDYPSAIKDFSTYATAFPTGADAGDAAYNLGSAYLASTPPDYAKAEPAFTAAIKVNPKDAGAYYGRLIAYHNLKQYEKVIADSEAVITNGEPKSDEVADAYAKQGYAYDQLAKAKGGDKALGAKAIASIKQYTLLKPNDATTGQYYRDLIGIYSDPTTQIAEYTKSLTPPPADPKAAALLYFNRGVAYSQMKEYDKAIADFTKVTTLTPTDDEAFTTRAEAYATKGDAASMDLAIADYGKAIALKPNKPELLTARGDLYIQKKDAASYAKADADYTAYLAKAGAEAPSSAVLTAAQLKQALGKPDEAIAAYTKYLATEKDPAKAADATRRLGAAYLAKNDYPNVVKTYTDYLAKNPKDVVALSNRAEAYLRTNDFDKATADLNAALAVEPNNAGVLTQLGYVNSKIGDDWVKKGDPDKAKTAYDTAIAQCDKAIAAEPKYSLAYYRKGFAAYKCASGDVSGDAKYYDVALDAFNKCVASAPADDPLVVDAKKAIAGVKADKGG